MCNHHWTMCKWYEVDPITTTLLILHSHYLFRIFVTTNTAYQNTHVVISWGLYQRSCHNIFTRNFPDKLALFDGCFGTRRLFLVLISVNPRRSVALKRRTVKMKRAIERTNERTNERSATIHHLFVCLLC